MKIHIVQAGETATGIARQYGISLTWLMRNNDIPPNGDLVVGQALVILFPKESYRVQAGDTLHHISERFGIPILTLYQNNWFLQGQPSLAVGDELVLSYEGEKQGRCIANGYAYPQISSNQLTSTLPYLTYLSPFTYGVSEEGTLLPLNDCDLLSATGRFMVAPLLHLSTLTEQGKFSSERASLVLHNSEVQEQLIHSVLETMKRRNFAGIDVDFEYIPPSERELYVLFLERLRERLNPMGYPVIVALAPKTSDEQTGLLYEAHDYRALGQAANYVFVMTYEWGYTYGPPMAVAPLPQVEEVISYGVGRISPEKIWMGIPLYGYDWSLPFEAGKSKARSISPEQALELARRNGAEIQYDGTAQSPYFYYTGWDGRPHVVWFEDARSIYAKLQLVLRYGLGGVGYWHIGRPFPQNWLLLHQMFEIEKVLL